MRCCWSSSERSDGAFDSVCDRVTQVPHTEAPRDVERGDLDPDPRDHPAHQTRRRIAIVDHEGHRRGKTSTPKA